MRQKMFLFSVSLVLVFSGFSQPRRVMAQATDMPAGPFLRLAGPTAIAGPETLEVAGLLGERKGFTGEKSVLDLIVRISNPDPGEKGCSQIVPTQLRIGVRNSFILEIRHNGGELSINNDTGTPLPECLSGPKRLVVDVLAPISDEYLADVTDPLKWPGLLNKLGFDHLIGCVSVLDADGETKTGSTGVGEDAR